MNTDETTLGDCPDCGGDIPEAWILVEYEQDGGETGIWAECTKCDKVVAPE